MHNLFTNYYEFIDYLEGMPMKYFLVGIPEFPFHWHKEVEILFVLKGSIRVLFTDRSKTLCAGQIIIIDRYQAHAFEGFTTENIVAILQFDSDLCAQYENGSYGFLQDIDFFRTSNPKGYENLQRALAQLGREFLLKRNGYQLALRSWFYRILSILARQVREKSGSSPIALENELYRMRMILQYIDDHYCEPLYLDDLAHQFSLSPSRISHIFSETVGMPFGTYVAHKRIQKAKTLLESSSMTVLCVAIECGLSHESALYRLFRNHEKTTPNAYRNLSKRPDKEIKLKDPGYLHVGSDQIFELIKPYLTAEIF